MKLPGDNASAAPVHWRSSKANSWVLTLASALLCFVCTAQAHEAASNLDRHVIVAIAARPDPAPMTASTARGYGSLPGYSGSARNKLTSADIAREHQLVEIAAWNIDLLQLHCMLFEIPVEMERDLLLERLRSDRRVKLAQPQQVFITLGQTASGH